MRDKGLSPALLEFFKSKQWEVVDTLTTQPRPAELLPVDDLPLAGAARKFLDRRYPEGIYRHQKEALASFLAGKNVCLVTGTASGKSLVFQTAALDLLSKDPAARVMAIYPMKALSNEQQDRWQATFEAGGLSPAIGRIDGNVPPGFRLGVLERSQVIVFTPDIIHAWLFSNLKEPAVIDYLRRVRLIVVDEVHAYSGVFGSNSAFLFRRLQHVLYLLGASPTYICASATIAHPEEHLRDLLGLDFALVGPERDTSPRFPLEVTLAKPPGAGRFLDEVVSLLEYLTQHTSSRFIAFVDSRKQVELISSILNRLLKEERDKGRAENGEEAPKKKSPAKGRWGSRAAKASESEEEEEDGEGEVTGVLQTLNVLPYRAGYEDHDRRQIQERLTEGTLNGVVSTSALELGIDIPHLDTCILIGVPASATSLQQRIGRIGRSGPGHVIVVNGGDVHDQVVFSNPQNFFQRPLAESALYLENEHIQYIHALCLAREGGEHDQASASAGKASAELDSPVRWPRSFIQLCLAERSGNPPRHLMSLKFEARDRPNYTFPLRDVESQFKVERRDGPNVSSLGSLSFGQLMREAYPGAIYYYATVPYRVTHVSVKGKTVQVRREKRYTTQPQRTPPAVFPRLNKEGVSAFFHMDGLALLESSLLVRESIKGVIEQRGRSESHYPYPLARELGLYQEQPYFSRNFFTTGVILTHPALSQSGVSGEALASLLFEAFMLKVPFERQDIGSAADHFRSSRLPVIQDGQPFLAIYDQTYGSLRLSRRLLDSAALGQVLVEAMFLAGRNPLPGESSLTPGMKALAEMAQAVYTHSCERLEFAAPGPVSSGPRDPARWERVVLPGSRGLMVRTNEEFEVQRITMTPAGLSYEGTPVSLAGATITMMPLVSDVAEVPGESRVGWFDLESGAVEPVQGEEVVQVRPAGAPEPAPPIDARWLNRTLATYLDGDLARALALRMGVKATPDAPPAEMIERLVAALERDHTLPALLSAALEIYVATAAQKFEQPRPSAEES